MTADRGSVVAEFAVAMPAVLLVLALALAGVQVTSVQVRAQDAAADAARAWARADTTASVAARVARQVPGARVSRTLEGDLVCATVSVAPTAFTIAKLKVRSSQSALPINAEMRALTASGSSSCMKWPTLSMA